MSLPNNLTIKFSFTGHIYRYFLFQEILPIIYSEKEYYKESKVDNFS